MDIEIAKLFAAALSLISIFGVALSLGNIFSSYINSTARNPGAEPKFKTMTFIGMALVEALGIFALVVAFLMLFS
jgi:F-type H+-transporting ATPase subunit c